MTTDSEALETPPDDGSQKIAGSARLSSVIYAICSVLPFVAASIGEYDEPWTLGSARTVLAIPPILVLAGIPFLGVRVGESRTIVDSWCRRYSIPVTAVFSGGRPRQVLPIIFTTGTYGLAVLRAEWIDDGVPRERTFDVTLGTPSSVRRLVEEIENRQGRPGGTGKRRKR